MHVRSPLCTCALWRREVELIIAHWGTTEAASPRIPWLSLSVLVALNLVIYTVATRILSYRRMSHVWWFDCWRLLLTWIKRTHLRSSDIRRGVSFCRPNLFSHFRFHKTVLISASDIMHNPQNGNRFYLLACYGKGSTESRLSSGWSSLSQSAWALYIYLATPYSFNILT